MAHLWICVSSLLDMCELIGGYVLLIGFFIVAVPVSISYLFTICRNTKVWQGYCAILSI